MIKLCCTGDKDERGALSDEAIPFCVPLINHRQTLIGMIYWVIFGSYRAQ
jgi:hypothetical protein